jgi:SAM-dependent methyltransferase
LTDLHGVTVIDSWAEEIPLPKDSFDVIYTRQVLHHTRDLPAVMRECARLLRPNGVFLACREHVVDDERQMNAFLSNHVMQGLTGGEGAYSLGEYTGAIEGSGLALKSVLGPFDSVINAFPLARTQTELEDIPRKLLEERFGRMGRYAASLSGVSSLVWRLLNRPTPGRLYSFLAQKS